MWVGGGTESERINRGSKSIRYVSCDTFVNVTCYDSDLSFNLCNQVFRELNTLFRAIYLPSEDIHPALY